MADGEEDSSSVVRTARHEIGWTLLTGTEIHAVAPVGLNPHGIVIVP